MDEAELTKARILIADDEESKAATIVSVTRPTTAKPPRTRRRADNLRT